MIARTKGKTRKSLTRTSLDEGEVRASVEIYELSDRIWRLADTCHQSIHELILDAIEQHADRLEAKTSFVEEADASWETYRNDSLHLTDDGVCEWLKSVATNYEKPMPECHR